MLTFDTIQEALDFLQSNEDLEVSEVYVCCPRSIGSLLSPIPHGSVVDDKTDIQKEADRRPHTRYRAAVLTEAPQPAQRTHHNRSNRDQG